MGDACCESCIYYDVAFEGTSFRSPHCKRTYEKICGGTEGCSEFRGGRKTFAEELAEAKEYYREMLRQRRMRELKRTRGDSCAGIR